MVHVEPDGAVGARRGAGLAFRHAYFFGTTRWISSWLATYKAPSGPSLTSLKRTPFSSANRNSSPATRMPSGVDFSSSRMTFLPNRGDMAAMKRLPDHSDASLPE